MNPSRRRFIRVVAATATTAPFIPWTQQTLANVSKNDRPTIGCIGVGHRGIIDAREHSGFGDIVAICDVDQRHAEEAKNDTHVGNKRADLYSDYRRVLDRKDINVVSVV